MNTIARIKKNDFRPCAIAGYPLSTFPLPSPHNARPARIIRCIAKDLITGLFSAFRRFLPAKKQPVAMHTERINLLKQCQRLRRNFSPELSAPDVRHPFVHGGVCGYQSRKTESALPGNSAFQAPLQWLHTTGAIAWSLSVSSVFSFRFRCSPDSSASASRSVSGNFFPGIPPRP